ncbi:MAG: hypothetical protein N2170_09120 [Bacteroidia bacterium]|nr:hypothetical protein [Bacteroidia bacterium]
MFSFSLRPVASSGTAANQSLHRSTFSPLLMVALVGLFVARGLAQPTIVINPTTPTVVCGPQDVSVPVSFSPQGNFNAGNVFVVQVLSGSTVVASDTVLSSPGTAFFSSSLQPGTYTIVVSSTSPAVSSQPYTVQYIHFDLDLQCTVQPDPAQPGNPATFSINPSITGSFSGTVNVFFNPGDGSGTQNLSFSYTGSPITFTHTYTTVGYYSYTIQVDLGLVTGGSTFGCRRSCSGGIRVAASTSLTGGSPSLQRMGDFYRIISSEAGQVRIFDNTGRLLLTASTEEAFTLPAVGPCLIQVVTSSGIYTFRTLSY